MEKTTQVAKDRDYDPTIIVLPTEVVRGVYMHNSPSLRALKLMHLMIAKAGGRMAEPVTHKLRLAEINNIDGMVRHDQESIKPLFLELSTCAMVFDEPEKKRYTVGTIMDKAVVDYQEDLAGDITVSWTFGSMFLDMGERSNHWAILDRQTVFHLGSKYSVLLFQYFASLQNLKHKTCKVFTVDQLRSMLGIEQGKITRFSTLNQRVIQPAISEINQLARFNLTSTMRKTGRTVTSVEISWEPKPDLTDVKLELGKHNTGREARRDGSAELIVPPFPDCGGLSATAKIDQHWRGLFEENVKRVQGNHLPDSKQVCDAFRKARGDRLDQTDTERHFVNFCKRWQG